ncbi:MAG: hypothetical protein AAFO07_27595, partial [Bacteroidota bacterium]
LSIEIYPKLDLPIPDIQQSWSALLIEMLAHSRSYRIYKSGIASLNTHKNRSLLQYFVQLIISGIEDHLLKVGFPKSYRPTQQQQSRLKGRPLVNQNNKLAVIDSKGIWVQYEKGDHPHWSAQLYAYALHYIYQRPENSLSNQKKIHQLLKMLPTLKECQPLIEVVEKVPQNIAVYRSHTFIIELARMICKSHVLGNKSGQQAGWAILFDMNLLFEDLLVHQLAVHLPNEMAPSFQETTLFWKDRTLRPDIVIRSQQCNYVIDLKWKHLSQSKPSMEDLRQLYVYAHYFEAQQAILMYPKTTAAQVSFEQYFTPKGKEENPILGRIIFVDLLSPSGGFNSLMGQQVVNQLLSKH